MHEFKAWEDFQSSLKNPLQEEKSIPTEKEEDWMGHMLALEEAGNSNKDEDDKDIKTTIWAAPASEDIFQDPDEYNVFNADIQSETLPFYLKRCVAKYDSYPPQDRAFLSEALLSWFLIEGRQRNYSLEDSNAVWRLRLIAMRATFNDMDKYLGKLIQCVNVQEVFPVICRVLKEGKEEKFSLIEDFLKKEASYYRSISIREAVLTFPEKKAKRFIEGKKMVETMDFPIEGEMVGGLWEGCRTFVKQWKPERIVAYLDTYLIGQEEAKKAAAMLLYSHVLRILHPDVDMKKSNFLFLGPTGCGKTELFRLLKKISPVSIHIADSTSLTSEGFVGLSKGDLLKSLGGGNGSDLESSILVLDECDKFIQPEFSCYGENINVSIQGDILKMVEGSQIFTGSTTVDTKRMTIVFTGAFVGLLERGEQSPICGFLKEAATEKRLNVGDDFDLEKRLCDYGMIPELAGRIGEFVILEALTRDDYLRILELATKPESSMAELYKREDGIGISFAPNALEEIAEQAVKSNLGVRKLLNLVEQAIREEFYDAMKDGREEAVITKERICKMKRRNTAGR